MLGSFATVPCQAPLSVGFPRQECWSRLPFPSPDLMILLLMLSEKNLIGYFYIIPFLEHCCLVDKSGLIPCNPMDSHQAPLSMRFPRQEYWSGCYFLLQRLFLTQGLNLHFPQADSFTIEPPGKPLYDIPKQQNCMDEEQMSDCLGLMIREGGQYGYKGVHDLGKPCYDETVVHLGCGDEPTHVIYRNT